MMETGEAAPKERGIPMSRWGQDHWQVFAYIESVCVERSGLCWPDRRKIQANHNRHPLLVHYPNPDLDGAHWPIRLKGEEELPGPDYDEWDCIEDLEREGLLRNVGTGVNPAYRMTEAGSAIAGQLRRHKANGGDYKEFEPEMTNPAGS